MTDVSASLAPSRRYPPGDLAIWIFILAELLVFAVFFAAYAFARLNDVELFNAYQQTLDRQSALINTLALITGSATHSPSRPVWPIRKVSTLRPISSSQMRVQGRIQAV